MPAPYSAITIANSFLDLAEAEGRELTQMQVIKLVYVAHGWSLSLLDRPLINERVEAWQFGPVISSLYQHLKKFGAAPVKGRLPKSIFDKNTELDPVDRTLIEQVYEKYGRLSGVQLSHLTHRSGTPWSTTYRLGVTGKVIPNEVIKDHYDQARAG